MKGNSIRSALTRPRGLAVLAALGALLALGACATTASQARPDPYHEVNRSLRGERAIVELAGGEAAVDVRHVHLSPEGTTWTERSEMRSVPTNDVSRVIVIRPHRERGPAAIVLLVGLGLSLVLEDARPFALALEVALDEFVWGMPVGPDVGRVVYTGES